MAHIDPEWPPNGLENWDDELVAGLQLLVDKVNEHDDTLGELPSTSAFTILEADEEIPEGAPANSVFFRKE